VTFMMDHLLIPQPTWTRKGKYHTKGNNKQTTTITSRWWARSLNFDGYLKHQWGGSLCFNGYMRHCWASAK
jgi:hypothetical protein